MQLTILQCSTSDKQITTCKLMSTWLVINLKVIKPSKNGSLLTCHIIFQARNFRITYDLALWWRHCQQFALWIPVADHADVSCCSLVHFLICLHTVLTENVFHWGLGPSLSEEGSPGMVLLKQILKKVTLHACNGVTKLRRLWAPQGYDRLRGE